MSTMVQPTKNRRLRRQFDDEFKASAVRLVLDDGKSAGRVARDLDLTESALRRWVDQAQADRAHGVDDRGTGGVAAVAEKRISNCGPIERSYKKVAAFFAKHQA